VETALRRIADTLLTFVDDTVARYGGEVWWPSNWPGITWALLAVLLVLLWVASRRQRRPRGLDVRPPQLLVTNGEVVPDASDAAAHDRPAGGRPRRLDAVVHAASGTLAMTVSNLSRYPVQVLEVALRDEPRGAPRVVAVDAVVPAMGSVTVEGPVPLALRGDGWLDLYCYAAATRTKMHRHRVELVWEPWSARFKVAPLEQAVVAVRRLASDEPRARFLDAAVVGPAAPTHGDGAAGPALTDPDHVGRPAVVAAVPAALPEAPEPTATPAPRARPTPRPAAARSTPRGPEAPTGPAEAGRAGARVRGDEREAPRGAGHAGRDDPGPQGAPDVPRIATPPVGVAVTGRGGTAARAPGGYPIGRPRAAPDAPAGDAVTAVRPPSDGPARDGPPADDRRDGRPALGSDPAAAAAAAPAAAPATRPAPTATTRVEPPTRSPAAPTRTAAVPERTVSVPAEPVPEPAAPVPEAAVPVSEPARPTREPARPAREPARPAREAAPSQADPAAAVAPLAEPEPDATEPEAVDAGSETRHADPAPAAKPRRPRLEFPDEF
jgi:hypothetical protein